MDTDVRGTRWQDWITLLLGAWLFVSPFLMAYPTQAIAAAPNAHLMGAAIVMLTALAMFVPRAWEETFNMLIGAWTLISPWALGYAAYRNVTVNAVVVGALVAGLSFWAMWRARGYHSLWPVHHRMHTDHR